MLVTSVSKESSFDQSELEKTVMPDCQRNYMHRYTRTRREICLKLTIKTPEMSLPRRHYTTFTDVVLVSLLRLL